MSTDRAAAMDAFLKQAGWGAAMRTPMPGDASTRRYVRLDAERTQGDADGPAASPPKRRRRRQAQRRNNAARSATTRVARLAGADCGRFVAAANYLRAARA